MSREERLARTLVELADTVVDGFDVVDLLVLLTARCVELLDVSASGLLLADPGGVLRLMAATSEEAELVELFQLQSDEGPCLDCYRSGEPVFCGDLGAEDTVRRWPRLVPVAAGAGSRAAHALPLRLRGRVLGALNLFRGEPAGMTGPDVAAAQALADIATIALLQHRAADDARMVTAQLRQALDSRVPIEQAKRVVAERVGVEMGEAFAPLRGHARRTRRPLADVAREVVEGTLAAGQMPPRG